MKGGEVKMGMSSFISLIVGILFTAVVLMIVSNMKVGLKVDGFKGAIIAAIAIGIVNFILMWVLGVFMAV